MSVIIPVYNEDPAWLSGLRELLRQPGVDEVVVVDASDPVIAERQQTLIDNLAEGRRPEPVVRMLRSASRGRAGQMNLGAGFANGDILFFLHADSTVPAGGVAAIRAALAAGARWGRFDVRLDAPGVIFRVIERAMNLRSAWSGIATGDQGIFIERDAFELAGRFPQIELMEDIELSRRLRASGRPARIRRPLTTSARRWLADGAIRTVFRMWTLRFLYFAGVPPQRLAAYYRPVR